MIVKQPSKWYISNCIALQTIQVLNVGGVLFLVKHTKKNSPPSKLQMLDFGSSDTLLFIKRTKQILSNLGGWNFRKFKELEGWRHGQVASRKKV